MTTSLNEVTSQRQETDISTTLITKDVLISDELSRIFRVLIYTVACQTVDVFGAGANIINIICFVKHGFKDPVNVSLLGLAISDFGCVTTLMFSNICFNPAFQELDLPFEPSETQYLLSSWPHVIFARVTSWITAFITMERCLCITMPLKVRNIITRKRATVIIIFIFVILIASVSPVYYVSRLAWVFSPQRNRTIIGLVFTADRVKVETVSYAVNNLVVPFISFIIVIVCTIVLVINLQNKAKWREMSAKGQGQSTSTRDRKVTKMVVVISTMFIMCYLPLCTIIVATILEPKLSINGQYKNTIIVVAGFGFFMESINSAANTIIYYHMSTKYRSILRQMFRLDKPA